MSSCFAWEVPGALHPYSWRVAENARAEGQKHQEEERPYSGSRHTWSQTRISVTSLRFFQWGCNVKVLHNPGCETPVLSCPTKHQASYPGLIVRLCVRREGAARQPSPSLPECNMTEMIWVKRNVQIVQFFLLLSRFLLFFCFALDLFSDPLFSTNLLQRHRRGLQDMWAEVVAGGVL